MQMPIQTPPNKRVTAMRKSVSRIIPVSTSSPRSSQTISNDSSTVSWELPTIALDLRSILQQQVGDFSLTYMMNGQLVTIGNLNIEDRNDSSSDIAYEIEYEMHPDSPKNRKSLSASFAPEKTVPQLRSPFTIRESLFPAHGNASTTRAIGETSRSTHELVAQHTSIDPTLLPRHLQNMKKQSTSIHRKECCLKIIRENLLHWGIEDHTELMHLVEKFRDALLEMTNVGIRMHATQLVRHMEPRRRILAPFTDGIALPGTWPLATPYRDPAHLLSYERMALIIWCYLYPRYSIAELHTFLFDRWQATSAYREKIWSLVSFLRAKIEVQLPTAEKENAKSFK